MSFFTKILAGGALDGITKLVDTVYTSEEERMAARARILEIQLRAFEVGTHAETARMEARASIVKAEAESDSWITKSWRPITMLTLLAGVILHQFGIDDAVAKLVCSWVADDCSQAHGLDPAGAAAYLQLVTVGLGGYVVARSADKFVKKAPRKGRKSDESKEEEI